MRRQMAAWSGTIGSSCPSPKVSGRTRSTSKVATRPRTRTASRNKVIDLSQWPWLALIGLGVFHGLNPAMGWLFAVALGFQEGNRGAVLRALPPIALGHEAAIVLVVALVGGLQAVADPTWLRLV